MGEKSMNIVNNEENNCNKQKFKAKYKMYIVPFKGFVSELEESQKNVR